MKTRKIILLSAVVLLGAIAILQSLFSVGDAVKTLTLDGKPDAIEIVKGSAAPITLVKDGDRWLVGEKKYPVDAAVSDVMIGALTNVRVLGTVSGSSDYERYGLDDASKLIITVSSSGKKLRTITAGKNAATGQQSYALVDSSKSVSMIEGSLLETFGKAIDAMRDRTIWTVPSEGITRIDIEQAGKGGTSTFAVAKAGNPPAWTFVPGIGSTKGAPDASLVSAWVSSLASLRADSFAPDGAQSSSAPILGSAKISAAGKVITISLLAKDGDKRYLCSSSETPYAFYLGVPAGNAFLKASSELVQ